jgi:opacity protein-like surface antigen
MLDSLALGRALHLAAPPETELVMLKRIGLSAVRATSCAIGLVAGAAIMAPAEAHAQITRVSPSDHRQAIGISVGGFFVRGLDSRDANDTILADHSSLAFDIKDFNNVSVGGEWLVGLGDYLEAGVGAGFYQKSVPTVYRGFTNTNGSEIEQDLKLRIVPLTATVRFLPIGRGSVEPYVGVGVGAFNWRYSEIGQFVDFSDNSIFADRFIAKGTALGPVVLAGLRAPVADVLSIGGELRWQKATGDTGGLDQGFLGEKIDLGGWNAAVTLHVRF